MARKTKSDAVVLNCQRLDAETSSTSMTRGSFLRMCQTSRQQSQSKARVPAVLKVCQNCPIGEQVSLGKQVFPENIDFINLDDYENLETTRKLSEDTRQRLLDSDSLPKKVSTTEFDNLEDNEESLEEDLDSEDSDEISEEEAV